eukprot:GHRR01003706.1.p1 GENE.GHRR01003706.1~~GHRR01003706.1.p1  ORF type:complete len:364 (+),score=151.03 GHRR01003706.1:935-2026(+)
MLDHFVHTFNPTWNNSIDLLLHSLCTYLIPLDRAIVKVYSLVIVGFITTVLVKWKTLAVEFYLLREQERSRLPMANTAGSSGTTIAAASSTEDLERLLVPLDAISSWLAYVIAGLVCAQLLGVDVTPLLAVGGASGIVVGLATQQLLTNAVMGLSLFLTRPFVAGDSVMCQSGQMVLSGVVEQVTPMRTTLRTGDDVLVTIPNKTFAEMILHNKSATLPRSRLVAANRKTEPLRLHIKVPHAEIDKLQHLQQTVMAVLRQPVHVGTDGQATKALQPDQQPSSSGTINTAETGSATAAVGSTAAAEPLVRPGSVELHISKFTDAGMELLVKGWLCVDPSSPAVQAMLLELARKVRQAGATMVTL